MFSILKMRKIKCDVNFMRFDLLDRFKRKDIEDILEGNNVFFKELAQDYLSNFNQISNKDFKYYIKNKYYEKIDLTQGFFDEKGFRKREQKIMSDKINSF